MSDDDRWKRSEPPARGPSAPNTMRFDPFATGLGLFFAIAIPMFVVGYTRAAGPNALIIALGIVLGLVAGVLAAIWLAHRDGNLWGGPQL